MPIVIRVVEFAGHALVECPHADHYVQEFDFEAHHGQGFGVFCKDPAKAKKFPTAREALEFWKTVPKTRPLRPDGQPNRPLTAATVELVEV